MTASSTPIWDGMTTAADGRENDQTKPARTCGCGARLCKSCADKGSNHNNSCTHYEKPG